MRSTFRTTRRRIGLRVVAVAAAVGVTVLGDLRLQASELARPAISSAASRPAVARQAWDGDAARVDPGAFVKPVGSFDDGVAMSGSARDDAQDDDGLRLVPAIYAWDPDVRFVFFRHVSKWM